MRRAVKPQYKEKIVHSSATAMRATVALLMGLGSFAIIPAAAAEETGWSGHLMVGGAIVPDYEGSDDYEPVPFATGKLAYDEYYVELRGLGLRANVMPADVLPFGLELGPSLSYHSGRDDVKNDQVDDLRNVDGSVAIGGFARIYTNAVLRADDELAFEVEVESGVGSDGDGTTIKFGPSYRFSPWESFRLGFGIDTTYASEKYNETYFSIDSDNARRSGFSAYDADGGIKDVGFSVNATYLLTERWSVTGMAGLTQLNGERLASFSRRRIRRADKFLVRS